METAVSKSPVQHSDERRGASLNPGAWVIPARRFRMSIATLSAAALDSIARGTLEELAKRSAERPALNAQLRNRTSPPRGTTHGPKTAVRRREPFVPDARVIGLDPRLSTRNRNYDGGWSH